MNGVDLKTLDPKGVVSAGLVWAHCDVGADCKGCGLMDVKVAEDVPKGFCESEVPKPKYRLVQRSD